MHSRRQNSNRRKRKTGFRARMRTKTGRKIVSRRRRLRGTFP